jgi:hypothetical protein
MLEYKCSPWGIGRYTIGVELGVRELEGDMIYTRDGIRYRVVIGVNGGIFIGRCQEDPGVSQGEWWRVGDDLNTRPG